MDARIRFAALLSVLCAPCEAHMPGGTGTGTRDAPVDLGDPTTNSWALVGELKPNEVKHYKFSIAGPTEAADKGRYGAANRFYTGMYVPGAGEPDFTFYVAIFGLSSDTECELWGDGWGRRRRSLGSDGHSVHDHDHSSHAHDDGPARITSAGTTWLMDSAQIPERVIGHDHGCSSGDFCGYHKPSETLVFIASPETDRPNKFESFSPTLFKPRGSCIADFEHGGEYRIAVWGDGKQTDPKRFSIGLGLAERDVFAPQNLVSFGYILHGIQTWNHWNGFVLVLPMILFVLAAGLALSVLQKHRPSHYGTSSGMATPFRALVLFASAMLLGHMVMNIAILSWASGNAHVEETREIIFPLVMGIILPMVAGGVTLLIGLNLPACCCCGPASAAASPLYRVTVGALGLLELFVQCGYIIAPAFLLLAALLPPALADRGLESRGHVTATTAEVKANEKGVAGTGGVNSAIDPTPITKAVVDSTV